MPSSVDGHFLKPGTAFQVEAHLLILLGQKWLRAQGHGGRRDSHFFLLLFFLLLFFFD